MTASPKSVAWRLEVFVGRADGSTHAAVVSRDGRLESGDLLHDVNSTGQFAAAVAGIAGLAGAGVRFAGGGGLRQTVIECTGGQLFVIVPLEHGAHLVVIASPNDRMQFAFDVVRLVEWLNEIL